LSNPGSGKNVAVFWSGGVAGSGNTLHDNDLWKGGFDSAAGVTYSNNLSVDPQYANLAAKNFTLLPRTPPAPLPLARPPPPPPPGTRGGPAGPRGARARRGPRGPGRLAGARDRPGGRRRVLGDGRARAPPRGLAGPRLAGHALPPERDRHARVHPRP